MTLLDVILFWVVLLNVVLIDVALLDVILVQTLLMVVVVQQWSCVIFAKIHCVDNSGRAYIRSSPICFVVRRTIIPGIMS